MAYDHSHIMNLKAACIKEAFMDKPKLFVTKEKVKINCPDKTNLTWHMRTNWTESICCGHQRLSLMT